MANTIKAVAGSIGFVAAGALSGSAIDVVVPDILSSVGVQHPGIRAGVQVAVGTLVLQSIMNSLHGANILTDESGLLPFMIVAWFGAQPTLKAEIELFTATISQSLRNVLNLPGAIAKTADSEPTDSLARMQAAAGMTMNRNLPTREAY